MLISDVVFEGAEQMEIGGARTEIRNWGSFPVELVKEAASGQSEWRRGARRREGAERRRVVNVFVVWRRPTRGAASCRPEHLHIDRMVVG